MELLMTFLLLISLSDEDIIIKRSHFPPTGVPTFLRDAVEQSPQSILDRSASFTSEEYGSKSLPLRTAVESIPDMSLKLGRLPLRDAVEKRPPPDEPLEVDDLQGYPSYTVYSPLLYFHSIVTPYRVDNRYQQLVQFPVYKGRSLKTGPKIVCYVQGAASYRKEPLSFSPEDLDPFACTHVIYAFASIDPHTFNMISNDDQFDIVQGGYRSVVGLKRINPHLKILISIGEGPDGSHRFTKMVASASHRRDFIRSVIDFVELYDFDGVDLHWQYPGAEEFGGSPHDKIHFTSLLEEMSEIFKAKSWILSVAVPASRFRIGEGFDPESLGDLVDFINLQAYDFHKDRGPIADHHANLKSRANDEGLNLFLSVDYSVKFWLKKGFPRSKILLGIPFFGRSFTLQYDNETAIGAPIKGPGREGFYTQTPGMLAYFEICDLLLNEGWHRSLDKSGSPYIVLGDQWIGYDDPDSIQQKIAYVKETDLGGVSVWSADLDDFKGVCGAKWSLLSAINGNLKGAATSKFICDGDGLYNDPKNCQSYYVCRNGQSYHLSCNQDMMFDPTKGQCGRFSTDKCIPDQIVYIANALKDFDNTLKDNLKEKKAKVVCYVTNWAFYRKSEGKFVPEHIDQRLCTHVVYAFASLDPEKLMIKEFDPWADLDNNLYQRITSLKDTKVLLSLGGWTDSTGDKYSRLVSDGSARRRFVIGTLGFLRKHNFAGLHFDWNYPVCWQSNCKKGPVSDKPNFTKLIQELRKEFDKATPKLLLAAAISGYKEVIDVSYDLAKLGNDLDFMSVMTYDYHGAWERQTGHVSPLYSKTSDKYPQYNTNFTMEYLVSKGAPRDKLLVGIPFYGQSFTLSGSGSSNLGSPSVGPGESGEYTRQPGMLAYYEICYKTRNSRWTSNRDDTSPYAYYKNQWVSYEDSESIKRKADYIKTKGFGGAVAWTIDLDDFSNRCCSGSFPLLRSLNRGLGLIPDVPTKEDCTKPPKPSTPVPPQTTTGVDSGAESTTEHMHSATKPTKPSTWWSTSSTSSTWWSTSSNPSTWWSTTESTPVSTWWPTTTSKKTTVASTTEDTTIPSPAVVMPENDKPTKSCRPGQYLPDPKNCNAFYRCILGELRKQYCAGGLHWNKNRNVCDWPSVAKCDDNRKPTKKPTRKPTTTYWQTRPTSTTTIKSTTVQFMEDQCVNGQYYPHESCSSFYICVNGHLITQNCAPGLYWSLEKSMCDWKFRITCYNRRKLAEKYSKLSNEITPQPYSACGQNSFAAYPGDCTQYLHCLWGKYDVFQCAPGLHWNNERSICDWPDSAHCKNEESSSDIPSSGNPPTTSIEPSSTSTTEFMPTFPSYEEWHPPIPPTSEKPPLSQPLKPHSGYFKIVCYFTNWAWYRKGIGKYLPEDIDADLCTHIVYGFAVLDYENLVIKAHDSWADFDNRFYERVTAYKKKGVKVSIAIGGWNDSQGDKYSRLVNNPSARARFIKHILAFLKKYNFDGLDLDWEYPKCWQVDCKKGPDSDKQAFSVFVTELKEAFKPEGYLLSSAVSPSKTVIDAGYDVPVLAANLDWIAVMTYDFHGQWDKQTGHVAPLYYHPDDEIAFFNANFSINYWITEGVPRRKIVMGMPLYGQSFQLEKEANNGLNAKAPGPGQAGQFTRAAGFLAYYEICDNIKNKGWTVVHDPKQRLGPYAFKGNQWVSYDDQEMIQIKSEYIKRMDLGGGMIWALDLDDFKNRCGEGRHPLLTTIRNVLANQDIRTPETTELDEDEPAIEETIKPEIKPESEFKVICYFTNWAWYRQGTGKYLPSNIDPDLCSHIVYGFAVLDADQLIIKPHDSWADLDNKFYEKVTIYKAKGIKVLVAIGGWNDSAGDKYSKLVNNPSARRRFIAHVADFIEANNFDGLDLDWEYPKCWQVDCNKGPMSDKTSFALLVKELHDVFKPKGWLLSSAVSPSKRVIDAGYDVPVLSQYLDWIAVMCYDYHGQWDKQTGHVAPMYTHPDDLDITFNSNFTIHYWIEKGADRRKLIMGMPMYGQSFSLADNSENGLNALTYGGGEAGEETRARGFLAYYEICTNIINKGWTVVRDRKGRIGPYAYLRDQWVSFDDIGMIRHKSEYIKAMGLGGGMIWALDLDDFQNLCGCEEYPLLRTINRVLRGYAKPDPKCVLGKVKLPTVPDTTTKPNETTEAVLPPLQGCNGLLFVADQKNCNQYYLCNQGQLQLQACPGGLYWNKDHCDWPENTVCHPDATTLEPITEIPVQTSEKPVETKYKVVCYFTNWAWYRQGDGKYLPRDIDSSLCTHINYGFAVLDSNTLTLKPHDSWADIDNDFYKKVIAYKSKGVKILIALGGWNDSLGDKYSRLVNDALARARFVEHIVRFIEKWGFDGLDLDWEYPKCWQVDCNKGPSADKEGFAALIKELSASFRPRGMLLSSAVSPSKAVIDAGYDVPILSQYFDWIAVMTYDFHGHWDKQTGHVAPLFYYPGDTYDYFNANFSINYWIEQGAPPSKLVMGIPLYGQSFSLADSSENGLNAKSYGPGEAGEYTRAGGFLAFYEICERIKQRDWQVIRDSKGRIGPYAFKGNQWVSYDDIEEVRRKSQLIKELGLGGGMVWALDLDDFRNRCGCGKHPLLKTLNKELRNITITDVSATNCT